MSRESNLELYEAQLAQVNNSILQSNEESHENLQDLITLKSDLLQLIQLTKDDANNGDVIRDEPPSSSSTSAAVTTSKKPNDDQDLMESLRNLEGEKCRGLFNDSYHNAIIFNVPKVEKINEMLDVDLQVVFSHPTVLKMVPCQHFMNGTCKFPNNCKYSHGHSVKLKEIKEYVEPDYQIFNHKSNIPVLAKRNGAKIWEHAKTASKIDESDKKIVVQFLSGAEKVVNLSIENVHPLSNSSEDDDNDDDDNDEDNFIPFDILDKIPSTSENHSGGSLGDWEEYTRGIGSKLMRQMGYIHGTGLGKKSEGRVEPVTAIIYPSGKSLDWCMNRREKIGDVETKCKKESLKIGKLNNNKSRKERKTIFDLLNSLSSSTHEKTAENSKNVQSLSSSSSSSSSKKSSSQDLKSLRIQEFELSQEIRKLESEIARVNESYNRHKDRDPTAARSIRMKLESKNNQLLKMLNKQKSLKREETKQSDRKKLSIF